jgi:cold shock CspA family protein
MADGKWHLGQVRFYDPQRGFGFIRHVLTGIEYFVHATRIATPPVLDAQVVVFQLATSRKKPGTFEATYVNWLSTFAFDVAFLEEQFSIVENTMIKKAILNALPHTRRRAILQDYLQRTPRISSEIEYQNASRLFRLIQDIFASAIPEDSLGSSISDKCFESADDLFKVKLWLDGMIVREMPIALIRDIFNHHPRSFQEKVYQKLPPDRKIELLSSYIYPTNLAGSLRNLFIFLSLERLIDLKNKFIAILAAAIPDSRLSVEESEKCYDVFSSFYQARVDFPASLLAGYLYQVSSDFIRLRIWLHDFTDTEDYETYHANFIFLTTAEQVKYIKKLFHLLAVKRPGITYPFIQRLTGLTHSYADGRKLQLDFSCHVVLGSIEGIRSGVFPSEEILFISLSRQVEQNPAALLSLDGFFESCLGRSIPDKTNESEEGVKSIVSLKTIGIPRHIQFCEGVLFEGDGLDRDYKHRCWWCRRYRCYAANQDAYLAGQYEQLTLASFLTILDIQFDREAYFDFLGLLNKINLFLKHLSCRSCGYMLKPAKEGYFSFYRISNFVCSNPACTHKENVYLNHCLSGRRTAIKSRCYNVIDSRDTKRCNYSRHGPRDDFEQYGPYICNECGSCCSQVSFVRKKADLVARNWRMQPGLEWKIAHSVGHLERGEIFCYKCGTEMVDNSAEYQALLNLLEHPDGTFAVLKKGTNNYGFWYMVKADETFFERARNAGFKVSPTQWGDPTVQFIGPGNISMLICKTCSTKYNKIRCEFVPQDEQPLPA